MPLQLLSANTFFPTIPSVKSETPPSTAASLIRMMSCLRGYLPGFPYRASPRGERASRLPSRLSQPQNALRPDRTVPPGATRT